MSDNNEEELDEQLIENLEKTREIEELRESGQISVEEAKERSPVGWWDCPHCSWDGLSAPMRASEEGVDWNDEGGMDMLCPECDGVLASPEEYA